MAAAREFTAHMKLYDSQAHGRVLEAELAGPASPEGSERLTQTFNEEVARHQPQCLVINLREFELPFQDHLLAAFIGGYVALSKLGRGRKFAQIAAGKTAAALQKFEQVTRLESVLGRVYSDVETALAEAPLTSQVPLPSKPRQTEPSPPRAGDAPEIWFPDLDPPPDTHDFAEFAALLFGSFLLVMLLGWVWRPATLLFLIPILLLLWCVSRELVRFVRNCVRRVRWAWSFSGRVTARQAAKMLKADPNRYNAHAPSYGGWGTSKPMAAMLIEDKHTGRLLAVFPPSGD